MFDAYIFTITRGERNWDTYKIVLEFTFFKMGVLIIKHFKRRGMGKAKEKKQDRKEAKTNVIKVLNIIH
jgi:hypothetical protein